MLWIRAVWKEKSRDEEGTLPSNWVEEKFVRWPPKNVRHLYEQRVEPQSNWFKFELVKIKFCSDSFQECENFEYTTSTDIDEPLVEKQIKKRKLPTNFVENSDDSDDNNYPHDSNEELSKFPTPPKALSELSSRLHCRQIKSTTNSVCQSFLAHPKLTSSIKTSQSQLPSTIHNLVVSKKPSQSCFLLAASNIPIRSTPKSTQSRLPIPVTSTPSNQLIRSIPKSVRTVRSLKTVASDSSTVKSRNSASNEVSKSTDPLNAKFQKSVLFKLSQLTIEILEVKKLLERQSMPAALLSANNSMDSLEISDGPIDTVEQYKSLAFRCESPAASTLLLHLLKKIGGSDLGKTTAYIMSRLFTNSLMSQMNMDGRGNLGKVPFRRSSICKVVVDSIMYNFPNMSVAQAHNAIAAYLKQASWRIGGPKKNIFENKENVINDDQNVEEDDQETSMNDDVDQEPAPNNKERAHDEQVPVHDEHALDDILERFLRKHKPE
ncbi:uncharacterized protein LOC105850535 isoform X1 [Hydra vulgaris]|uniref:uncharacterized protein LOC105850535 isoform X1 n=1 Tax=Hydra vulgaris TaxID=6087 RepID=UPI0032EA59A4